MPAIDVINAAIKSINRLLPQNFSSKSIGTSAPTGGAEIAMGKAGQDGVVTIAMDSGESGNHTITAWVFSGTAKQWFKLGANSAIYSKIFEPQTIDGFVVPRNALIFLTADAVGGAVTKAYTDMGPSDTNPKDHASGSIWQSGGN